MNGPAVAKELEAVAKDLKAYGRMVHKREFYRPNSDYYDDIEEFKVPKDIDLEVWTYVSKASGKFMAVAFQGRAQKPLWQYAFRSESQRKQYIKKSIESRKKSLERKKERQDERKNFKHDLKVGSILYASWGYDQTNIDFYQVIEAKAKSVVIRKIGSRVARSERGADYVVPAPNKFTGKAMTKRVSPGNSVRIASYSSAFLWDGKPKYETASGWGH